MALAPYVSTAAFTAHPTYLDLDDLRVGDSTPGDQTAELYNILLMATEWADNYAEQPLGAHIVVQRGRSRTDRYGRLHIHLQDRPYIAAGTIAYGYTPTALTTVAGQQVWEENNNLLVPIAGASGPWAGTLQIGYPAAGQEVFVEAAYAAGWVATQTTGTTPAGATTLTLSDPTGIQPGGTYRIWEPGAEENVTVSPSWTPPPISATPTTPVATAVPLTAPTQWAHTAAQDVTNMPADLRLAVINYAVSQLLRPDTAAEDSYPDTHMAVGTRQGDTRQDGSGLVTEAERIIEKYRRVR
ncbi:hypothetical protein SCATT_05660 [Streptantibioticus cattleyicolor NRRL 8057 = DSM 46488]|uniref:Uncharacterized protein n=1 Tax=Streptantibioticus cattleyicolor (strain ATCC 35852 / DSM 46488 / JCM 4925 / NBRC 14057 / NRRL 8057) TaxID=1003195 RepID=F8JS27_STREN|nr:hypothetical protein SCATT_05660 [Streptantibioticus cattleyicolor NRRL 8057 = DSM 46488]MYS57684.1 hypothetical protein [Streptomyces sp. SID5468]CCB73296.1 protein of unknown function [Streptantibioticus cattleyicolor NRRL 8057 = DSM 46488]